jgi:AcrR family transcriptional regulator
VDHVTCVDDDRTEADVARPGGVVVGASPAGAGPEPAAASRGGRPRDPQLDTAILEATRRQLVLRGYSQLTIADIAADAGVSRPTIYRRWSDKFQLVSDALDHGLRAQERAHPEGGDPVDTLSARDAVREAVRRVDPRHHDPDAIVLQGDVIGESDREPELLDLLAARAVEPRVQQLERVLHRVRERGAIRTDVDLHTLATMCLGSFFGAHLRGERDHAGLADAVADTIWQLVKTPAAPD